MNFYFTNLEGMPAFVFKSTDSIPSEVTDIQVDGHSIYEVPDAFVLLYKEQSPELWRYMEISDNYDTILVINPFFLEDSLAHELRVIGDFPEIVEEFDFALPR